MRIFVKSLGCLKNSADSRSLIEGLAREGIEAVSSARRADVIIVNTCGFIEDAKRESIEEILRLAESKGKRRLIAMGCLTRRYGRELSEEMPELDAVYGVGEEERARLIRKLKGVSDPLHPLKKGDNGAIIPLPLSVPIKIAEGCGRKCSFCAIPSIRGPLRSRRPEDVLGEAEARVRGGARELVLVAQDLTAYGRDFGNGYGLPRLLRDTASISGEFWIRPLYLFPGGINEELVGVIAEERRICKYIDMPVQHSERRILRLMRRPGSGREYLRLIRMIREAVPDVALRTTVMAGFPGERKRDFEGLLDFIGEAEFERLGAFKYSREEGTAAGSMGGQVPERVKDSRLDAVMGLQRKISLGKNRALVGGILDALVVDGGRARIYSQADEVDGVVFIKGEKSSKPGEFVRLKITSARDYDLEGVIAGGG